MEDDHHRQHRVDNAVMKAIIIHLNPRCWASIERRLFLAILVLVTMNLIVTILVLVGGR